MVGLVGRSDRAGLLNSFTDNVVELEASIRHYQEGGCAILAARIRQLTGWEIWALSAEGDRPLAVHFLNISPSGEFVDSLGRTPRVFDFMLKTLHRAPGGKWQKRNSVACLEMEDEDNERVDRFLATPWMTAAVPVADRISPELPECIDIADED